MHCDFCGQDWNTDESRYKKLHGSYFSWVAFFWTLVVLAAIGFVGLRVADKMGYEATEKFMSLLGRQPSAQKERSAPNDRRRVPTPQVEELASDDAPVYPESASTSSDEPQTVEQVPRGRVRERKASEEPSEKTFETIINETESEAVSSENSDKDWDF